MDDRIAPPPSPTAPQRPMLVTVRLERGAAWRALVCWGPGREQEFDSPLELARFLVRLAQPRPCDGGLR